MQDEDDGIKALGLECISLMCADDTLEFYAAWRVVQRLMPTLPTLGALRTLPAAVNPKQQSELTAPRSELSAKDSRDATQRAELAARWIGLLGRGALDAELYPERAAAIIDLLWEATRHEAPQVHLPSGL